MGFEGASFSLQIFGPFTVTIGGTPLAPLRTQKGRWMLALLALRAGKPVERAWLTEMLWPDSEESQALYNLRRSLSDLRRALGVEETRLQTPTAHTILLDLQGAYFDVAEFDAVFQLPSSLPLCERAVALYHGPLLEGCQEQWVGDERNPREEKFLEALERLAAAAKQRRDFQIAAGYFRRILQTAPLREEALRNLMDTLADNGDIAAALEAYKIHRLLIRTKFNQELSPQTREHYEKIKAREHHRSPAHTPPSFSPGPPAGPPEGPLPVDSSLYIERATDPSFYEALQRQDSIILVKGPHQIGKTSLLARGLYQSRQAGKEVVILDLQKLPNEDLSTAGALMATMARHLAFNLNQPATPTPEFGWNPALGPNENFERFLRRHILAKLSSPLVWALDEVDRLFGRDYSSDIFALFRAWHNERALDPSGPWQRLTIAFSYATEAHLFIADLNQSPFNVGTRLELMDFTAEEMERLNERYGTPLKSDEARLRFRRLFGGHPYLTQVGLYSLMRGEVDMKNLEESPRLLTNKAISDHLRHLRLLLEREPILCSTVRGILNGSSSPLPLDVFYRLRTAGILLGDAPITARFRCGLYEEYLKNYL